MSDSDDKPPEEALPEAAAPSTPEISGQPEIAPEPLGPAEPATASTDDVSQSKKSKKKRGPVARWLLRLFLIALLGPPLLTLVYRFVPPPITILMVQRAFEGRGLEKHWRSLDDISPALAEAVIAAEDAKFCSHHGFDIEAIQKALKANERGGRVRGGSTISQQTAKNVFLWPGRTWVRKGAEAYFTVLIEAIWGKRRIMEVYLNVAEWGSGVYGAEAAARRYFHTSAADLNRSEASRLAAVLPSPLKWKAAKPGPYVARRSRRIRAAANTVRSGLSGCLH
jgi:monofunctional biosynthetic peptidoglycan transglycosylase